MAEIPTYTANLASARGQRGQIQAELGGSGVLPATALGNVGESIQRAALTVEHIGAIKDQRQKEQELRWVGDSSDQLSRVLIQWQQDNSHREDVGDAYRSFADEQVAKYSAAAPNTRAVEAFKRHVLPAINSDWEQNLKRGERTRQDNFITAETSSSSVANDAYASRLKAGQGLEGADIRSHDLQMQIARIDTVYGKTSPKVTAALKEQSVVDAVIGTIDGDPKFARELLDANSTIVDARHREVLINRIEASQHRIGSQELVARDQGRKDALANGLLNGVQVPEPDLSFEKANMDPARFDAYSHDVKQLYEVQNKTIKTNVEVAALNPAARNLKISEAVAGGSGETGLAVARSLAQMSDALDKEWKADPFLAVTKYNEDVHGAHQAFVKSGKQEDEDYWRTLAWDRMGHAPGPLEPALASTIGVLRPGVLESRKATALTYQELPEAERRYLLKSEAVNYADMLTKGGWEERLKAVQSLNQKFPDEHKRAVAIKDIEQLSKGKGPDIQRTLIAAKLAEVNPSAAQFLLKGDGRAAFKGLDADIQKQIGDLLRVGTAGSKPSWSLAALALRGANADSQDLVAGFRDAIEEVAALNFKNSAPDAVNGALKTLIFDRVALPKMTPSVGSSPGQALMIGRGRVNPHTGRVDPSLDLRTDDEIDAISQRIAYAKEPIQPDDIQMFGTDGRAQYLDVIPSFYRGGAKEFNDSNRALLKEYITQKGFWISDADNQGATFYMQGEGGFDFAPVFKMTGEPLRIIYDNPPMADSRRKTPLERVKEPALYRVPGGARAQ